MTFEVLLNKYYKYAAIFQAGWRNASVYLFDIWTLGILLGLRVAVITQLYTATFVSLGVNIVDGFDLTMTVWSVMVANALQLSSAARMMILEIQDDIKSGNIVQVISKPYSLPLYYIFIYFGRFVARLGGSLLVGIIFAWIFVGFPELSVLGIIAGLILACLGFFINVSVSMVIALWAFWIEDISAFRWIYDKLQWILSGMIIPLALFPDSLRSVVEYSLFGQLFYSAGRIAIGFDWALFGKYVGAQVIWIGLLALIIYVVYNKGKKNVSINGG